VPRFVFQPIPDPERGCHGCTEAEEVRWVNGLIAAVWNAGQTRWARGTLSILSKIGLPLVGLAAVLLALKAQTYWAPLDMGAKQWDPGWRGYLWALGVFCFFLVCSTHIPGLFRFYTKAASPSSPRVQDRSLFSAAIGIVAVGLVLLVAQSFRFYELDTLPPGLWLDEGINVMDAEQINQSGKHSIYLHSMSTQRTALFVEILAQTLKWDWPNRVYAVRGTAAVLGLVTVFFFFILGWQMVSWRFGLLIAFLLAVSHWHVNYSRWGMEQILCPLFEIAALGLFFSAWSLGGTLARRESSGEEEAITEGERLRQRATGIGKGAATGFLYLMAGFFLGGGLYTYSNFRLFLIGIALYFLVLPLWWIRQLVRSPKWLLAAVLLVAISLTIGGVAVKMGKSSYEVQLAAKQLPIIEGRQQSFVPFLVFSKAPFLLVSGAGLFAAYLLLWSRIRRDWAGFGLMVIVAGVVMIPFFQASLSDWWAFTKRAAETSVFNLPDWRQPLRDMSTRTLLGMHWIGDSNGRHNLTYAPQLSWIPAAMSVLGLAYGVLTLYRPVSLLLVVWTFLGLLPGMVTWEAPHASRMLDALAPLLILAALAWREVYQAFRRVPWIGIPAFYALTLVGLLQIYKDDYRLYFIERPASKAVYESFLPDEAFAASYAGSLPREVSTLVDPQLMSKHNFWFYQGGGYGENIRNVRKFDVGNTPIADCGPAGCCFVMMRSGQGLVGWLAELYPKAKITVGRSPWGEFNFAAVHVTREEVTETYERASRGELKLRHGLLARYYLGDDLITSREVPRLMDWNIPDATAGKLPTRVTWDGWLWQPKSGPIHFGAHPQNVTIQIGGADWIKGRGVASREDGQYSTRNLGKGLHSFHAEFDHTQGVRVPYFVWMMWRAPGSNLPSPTVFPSDSFSPAVP
jgi:hypothetical protein